MNDETYSEAERLLLGAEVILESTYTDNHAEHIARAQVMALLSIAESLHTLTKHLTEKEEGAR